MLSVSSGNLADCMTWSHYTKAAVSLLCVSECSKNPGPCDPQGTRQGGCRDVYHQGANYKCECKPGYSNAKCENGEWLHHYNSKSVEHAK